MKILFVTATYLPSVNGVSYQTSILKKALEKRGHKVYVLAPSFPGYKDSEKNVIRYPSLPNPVIKSYPIGIPLYPIKKIKEIKPDLVHTQHPFIWGQFAKTISKRLSIPLFFTAHTQYGQYLDIYIPIGKKITSKLLKRDILEITDRCERVICPSKQTEERLNSMGVENTAVIHNSIENSFFNKPEKRSTKQLTIIFTGRIVKEKNIFFLLKIASDLKKVTSNFQMLIIGSGELLDSLREKVFKFKLQGNVLVAGELNRSLLPQIYKGGHLFVTPSLSEVMPLTVIEAMACGLPTIALENSGLEEVVVDGVSGYLVKNNSKLVAKKIFEIYSDKKGLEKLSKSAFLHAQNFSVNNKAVEYERIYKESHRI